MKEKTDDRAFAHLQPLPLGMQSFEEIIQTGHLYVDKTALIYKLLARGKAYFLSRPRRFGKSLLISTLQAIFEGKRHLFSGLALESLPYDWSVYPVIRLDLSIIGSVHPSENQPFDLLLKTLIRDIGRKHTIILDEKGSPGMLFSSLIQQLGQREGKVVILVDEYDKPILNVVHNAQQLQFVRAIMRDLYSSLKANDQFIRFLFLTGVSEFAQVSIFSGLNHLTKLTFSQEFGTLLGYTDAEIDQYFGQHILAMKKALEERDLDVRAELQQMYNGYQFCDAPPRVYNPYSVMRALEEKKFSYYWYQTGTPTFLVRLLEEKITDFFELENNRYNQNDLSEIILEEKVTQAEKSLSSEYQGRAGADLNPQLMSYPALLYQTGYWTIDFYDPADDNYALKIANKEVREALSRVLSTYVVGRKNAEAARKELALVRQYIQSNNLDALKELLIIICSGIPYTIQKSYNDRSPECYYQTIFYMIFWLANLPIQVETATATGRIDATLATQTHRYIFEFKIKESAQDALDQIKSRGYYRQFLHEPRKIVFIGVKFDLHKRAITEWLTQELE